MSAIVERNFVDLENTGVNRIVNTGKEWRKKNGAVAEMFRLLKCAREIMVPAECKQNLQF